MKSDPLVLDVVAVEGDEDVFFRALARLLVDAWVQYQAAEAEKLPSVGSLAERSLPSVGTLAEDVAA